MSLSDSWERADPYERYIGKWSRLVAPEFVRWLTAGPGQRWLDAGCGTGALSAAIVAHALPASVVGVEPSAGFLGRARVNLGPRVILQAGDAHALPIESASIDVATSAVEIRTSFADDLGYWTPSLGGQGPAPAYAMSLSEERRERLRARVAERLPRRSDGSILLLARAWTVRAGVASDA